MRRCDRLQSPTFASLHTDESLGTFQVPKCPDLTHQKPRITKRSQRASQPPPSASDGSLQVDVSAQKTRRFGSADWRERRALAARRAARLVARASLSSLRTHRAARHSGGPLPQHNTRNGRHNLLSLLVEYKRRREILIGGRRPNLSLL